MPCNSPLVQYCYGGVAVSNRVDQKVDIWLFKCQLENYVTFYISETKVLSFAQKD